MLMVPAWITIGRGPKARGAVVAPGTMSMVIARWIVRVKVASPTVIVVGVVVGVIVEGTVSARVASAGPEERSTVGGVKVAVTVSGRPAAARVTVPSKPSVGVTVTAISVVARSSLSTVSVSRVIV